MNKTSKIKKYSAFTLIEILIGTMIFAVVMVITTGVVGQSVGYQSKIRAIRQTSQESRRIAEMITNDVREANGEFSIQYTDTATGAPKTVEYDSGLALFGCTESNCSVLTESTNGSNADYVTAIDVVPLSAAKSVNTIVVKSENKIKVYVFYRNRAQAIYYHEYDPNAMDSGRFREADGTTLNTLDQVVAKSNNVHNDGLLAGSLDTWVNPSTSLEMKTILLSLQYYAPQKGVAKTKQIFFSFRVISELGLPTANPKEHATSIITTTVSSRGYNH